MQSAKETASNVAASARAGMEKTKAVAEEKAEKLATRDPLKKEMAEHKKDARINDAERMKHETRAENVAARRAHGQDYGHGYTATGTGATGYSTGTNQDIPSGYTAAPTGFSTGTNQDIPSAEDTFGEGHPTGTHTGIGRTGAQDPRATTGGRNTGYGSGATY